MRILNETLIASGLKVAREKLGFVSGRDPARAAQVNPAVFAPRDWAALVAGGYIRRYRVSNAESEAAFKQTGGAGLDADVAARPQAGFIDLYVGGTRRADARPQSARRQGVTTN